ncbi:hypothetical protein UWK_01121 [Desulfocapsa sulfexigens DSM 10523]|uniref:PEGA domain-containing protein n=1 Tax=Desulfocapsa sulfexigens (strain DSM 10523 / SB164P1) TaxID=1167006 RepID=M1ND51_DESSD|nr:hypothetical protein [Desulfocapsa sulfexigens]AGF77689.1 hypothetical protein UWK_01121 [Desulfocapsa sulfexigens DSM 10523]
MCGEKKSIFRVCFLVSIITASVLLAGCSSQKTVHFKINSVPKGAHVLYQVIGEDIPCHGQWVYLGNTPVQGVRQFDEDQLVSAEKITLKIMHNGYHEQVKEWDGPGLWQEVEERDVIFWTPELIASEKE